jgi:DNA repair protein RadC
MLIRDDQMSEGSVDEAAVYIREIMRRALDYHATASDPRPQPPQRRSAAQPTGHPPHPRHRRGGRHLKITVHDHFIVGSRGH